EVFYLTITALSLMLLVPHSRKVLLLTGRMLALPHLDMNVEFQPDGVLLRTLWILSSAITLAIQIPLYALLIPFRLVLAIVLFFLKTSDSHELPCTATFLLLLIPKKDRENLVGDLEEEFLTILLPRYGARRARIWYWEQVILSLGPILWVQFKRLAG